MKKYIITLLLSVGISFMAMSQKQEKIPINESDYNNSEIPMADKMREDGKIWVVVGTISVVMAGFIFYLVSIDRKISKLERSANTDNE